MTRYRINPGELRHIITFQKKSGTKNEYKEKINEWVDVMTARAAIYPLSGKEFYAAEKMNSQVTHKIHIRYNPIQTITSDMRIKFGTRIFELISPPINFQEKNIEIQLLCKELM
jgi:SPP1 family predicted phage head-tail adaptor